MATVYSVNWICKFKSPKHNWHMWEWSRERHIDRQNSREDTWNEYVHGFRHFKTKRHLYFSFCCGICPREDDDIMEIVLHFEKRHSEKRRQTPNSPLAKEVKQKYDKFKIVFHLSELGIYAGLQPLDPECTSFSPDGLDTEPQPPFKMFSCDDETLPY